MEGLFPDRPYPRDPPELRIRKSPMKVLCLGLSRTGTMSTYAGLKKLGYIPYHAAELSLNMANDALQLWTEATDAKFRGNGKTFKTATDFDKMLYKYDAVTDIPCVLFTNELLVAYPDAKVILTTRDTESWISSVEATFYPILMWPSWWFLKVFDPSFSRLYHPLISLPLSLWSRQPLPPSPRTALSSLFAPFNPALPNPSYLRAGYEAHNAHVRAVVPKERLLEWHPRDGWEPLCRHLDREIPEEFLVKEGGGKVRVKPFLNINEKGVTPKILSTVVMFRWIAVGGNIARFVGVWGLVIGVALVGWRAGGEEKVRDLLGRIGL